MRLLQELRERGTIAATAAALHLTPSAVSQQLRVLSREVGAPLLVRNGRGVRLTPQAHVLLEHAVRVNAQLERARADLAAHGHGELGRLVIGAFATAIRGPIARAAVSLRRDLPLLEVGVVEIEAPDCLSALLAGDLDIAVTVDYRGGPSRRDARFHRVELLIDPFDAVLPDSHTAARNPTLELAELAEERWIVGAGTGPCYEVTASACAAAGFSPDVHSRVSDWGAVTALVAAGTGVAIVPRLALGADLPGVAVRPINPRPPTRNIYAAVRAGAEQARTVKHALAALEVAAGHALAS
ncbi:MAG: hypothetical protein V7607_4507 [Solirubrobacteraceae bacterium]